MKKILKRLATGFLAFATIVTALPTTAVHASEKQYWTESAERVGIVEKVMNDGSIGSTFNEGHMTVEGEDAFCVDINTNFRNGYKTRADASTRMSYDQISDVALSIEYVNQYVQSHSGLSSQHIYLLKQCVVWQRSPSCVPISLIMPRPARPMLPIARPVIPENFGRNMSKKFCSIRRQKMPLMRWE